MQYFIQIRRADGSTYPTTVEAESLSQARRLAQIYTEAGETVENITEDPQTTPGTGPPTTAQMNQALEAGPTTLDQLYEQFEIQRAQPESGINQQLGTGETGTPIRTTGLEAQGVGFDEDAYQGPMRSVGGQTVNVGDQMTTLMPETKFDPLKDIDLPKADGPPDYGILPKGFVDTGTDMFDAGQKDTVSGFDNYLDRFLSDNARISGFAQGVDRMSPGQGLGASVLYQTGPIGRYFAGLQPEAEATFMAEDIATHVGKDARARGEQFTPNKTFDQFTTEILSADPNQSMFTKQINAYNSLLKGYGQEREAGNNRVGQGIVTSFSDRSENANTIIQLVEGMAKSMYGGNYTSFVNVQPNALYDAWSRDSAKALRTADPKNVDKDDDWLMKNRSDKNRISFLEYAANAYGVPTNETAIMQTLNRGR